MIVAGFLASLQFNAACAQSPSAAETLSLTSTSTTNTVKAPKATDILFEQASFWQHRSRGDLARMALQRILTSEPGNLRAMYALGMSYLKENNVNEANNLLKRMAATQPRSGYVALLSQQIKNNTFDQNRLKQARRLQAEGKSEQALKEYDLIFAGKDKLGPLALEYYHTMASVNSRRQEAISGLQSIRQDDPENDEVVFTLAQILTYDETTRRRGLDMLQLLAEKPAYKGTAVEKYREALLWLHASPEDESYFDYYLALNPQDKEVVDRLQSLATPVIDPDSYEGLLSLGFKSLNNNTLQQAKTFFNQATAKTEEHAEALAGLGLIEQRGGRHAAALDFYDQALAKDASLESKYQSAIDSARFWSSLSKINQRKYRDNPRAALAYLANLKAMSAGERREVALQRARIYSQANQFKQAERSYQQVLRDYPNEERAIIPLLEMSINTKDYGQLERLFSRYEAKLNQPGTGKQLKSRLYWAAASLQRQRSEMNRAAANFERALAATPDDAWIRLDYARLLLARGQSEKAQRIAQGISTSGSNKIEDSHALALFYSSIDDWSRVLATLDSVPQADQTEEMAQLRRAAEFRQDLEIAVRHGELVGPNAARNKLIDLYQSSLGIEGAAPLIVAALAKFDLRAAAISIIRQSMSQKAELSPEVQLAFTGYLIQWRELDLAQKIVARLNNGETLNSEQLTQLSAVNVQLLLARASAAMERQAYSQAKTDLNAALSIDPGNVQILRMLGQINQQQGNFDESIQRYVEAIRADPTDLWAIKGAVGAALQAEDLVIAREILDDAIKQFPREPDVYELLSRVARAAGDNRVAIESMAYARALRQQSSPR